ncbi:unnamed protein product [Psylliodes chrysocephalus]|uniref:Uncharacterized protein n=1 Tax=Psylliodes chrysocephalus TaxID=3402493 RepID=A0A9P0GLJ9_9CUCU|nr:unnamed protein product [Psylliodes chrysocephala]
MSPKNNKTKTREEILEQKRLTERLRYERLKKDPKKKEELREKVRRKYQIKKEKDTRKLVKDMNRREHNAVKKNWKEYCTTYRAKKKALQEVTNTFIRENTPDSECLVAVSPTPARSSIYSIINMRKSRAKKKRERIIREKDRKINHYKKKLEKYRKRLQRLEKANMKNIVDTPKTKLQKMCDVPETRKEVVKKAIFG